jgi:hypothetical protein
MPLVVVLGAILIMVTMIVSANVTSEHRLVDGDRNWEEALHVAESGVGRAIHDIDVGGAVSQTPLATTPSKDEVIAAATALATSDPTEVLETPEGDVVVLQSDTTGTLYAVGFSPGFGLPQAKERVLFVDYEMLPGDVPFTYENALLLDGDISVSGALVIKGGKGGIQVNDKLHLPGSVSADFCVGAGEFDGQIKDIKKVGPPPCPTKADVGKQDPVPLPDMAARDLWPIAEYQMCPDGKVRAAPGHPTAGFTAGAAPCDAGAQILGNAAGSPYLGWRLAGSSASKGAEWVYAANQPNNGAFYFYHGSVSIPTSPANWRVSVVTEADGSACSKVGGDVDISGNIGSLTYSTSDVGFFADRDLIVSGNKNAEGLMVAMEQVEISGNPSIDGMILVADECDTSASPVHESSISGNPTLRYDGGLTVPWTVVEPGAGGVGVNDVGEL